MACFKPILRLLPAVARCCPRALDDPCLARAALLPCCAACAHRALRGARGGPAGAGPLGVLGPAGGYRAVRLAAGRQSALLTTSPVTTTLEEACKLARARWLVAHSREK